MAFFIIPFFLCNFFPIVLLGGFDVPVAADERIPHEAHEGLHEDPSEVQESSPEPTSSQGLCLQGPTKTPFPLQFRRFIF